MSNTSFHCHGYTIVEHQYQGVVLRPTCIIERVYFLVVKRSHLMDSSYLENSYARRSKSVRHSFVKITWLAIFDVHTPTWNDPIWRVGNHQHHMGYVMFLWIFFSQKKTVSGALLRSSVSSITILTGLCYHHRWGGGQVRPQSENSV